MYYDEQNLGVLEAAAELPDELVPYFNRASKRFSNPIVLMIKDACSACFTTQPSQNAQKVKLTGFGVCERCARVIMYDDYK